LLNLSIKCYFGLKLLPLSACELKRDVIISDGFLIFLKTRVFKFELLIEDFILVWSRVFIFVDPNLTFLITKSLLACELPTTN